MCFASQQSHCCGFNGSEILLLFSMHTSQPKKMYSCKLWPLFLMASRTLQFYSWSSCFHKVGGEKLSVVMEALTPGHLQLVFSRWINISVNFSLNGAYFMLVLSLLWGATWKKCMFCQSLERKKSFFGNLNLRYWGKILGNTPLALIWNVCADKSMKDWWWKNSASIPFN